MNARYAESLQKLRVTAAVCGRSRRALVGKFGAAGKPRVLSEAERRAVEDRLRAEGKLMRGQR
jgi:hypothetical protein